MGFFQVKLCLWVKAHSVSFSQKLSILSSEFSQASSRNRVPLESDFLKSKFSKFWTQRVGKKHTMCEGEGNFDFFFASITFFASLIFFVVLWYVFYLCRRRLLLFNFFLNVHLSVRFRIFRQIQGFQRFVRISIAGPEKNKLL